VLAACSTLAACDRVRDQGRPPAAPTHAGLALGVDDFGDTVRAAAPATRIVSLNPTTTELMFALGAGARLVGRTHWDEYPAAARAVPDLGDGLRPNVEAVLAARPDVVVLYASATTGGRGRAPRAGAPWSPSDRPRRAVRRGRPPARPRGRRQRRRGDEADTVLASSPASGGDRRPAARVARLWPLLEPPLYVTAAAATCNELMDAGGATNVFGDLPQPRAGLPREALRRGADVVFSSPDGARRIARDRRGRRSPRSAGAGVYAADTALVLRPGVRLGEAAAMLCRALHPARFGGRCPPRCCGHSVRRRSGAVLVLAGGAWRSWRPHRARSSPVAPCRLAPGAVLGSPRRSSDAAYGRDRARPRLPRVALAALVGAALGGSGAALQGGCAAQRARGAVPDWAVAAGRG
jgi:hypothetical protein